MAPNAMDYVAIRDTLSRYCFILDSKNFDGLSQVFAPDVEAIYPMLKNFDGEKNLSTLIEALKPRLEHVRTQHALTTQTIEIAESGTSAETRTYFTATTFGTGSWEGQQFTTWGLYEDNLKLADGTKSIPGASGRWLIEKRKVVSLGTAGDSGMFTR